MRRLRSIRADQGGAALTEFGLLIPVFALLLMGAFDAGHRLYTRAVLQGAVQKAARDTGLEGASAEARQLEIDAKVRRQLLNLHGSATIDIDRRAYRDFTKAAAPAEPFQDTNKNGRCDGEPFEDINRNGNRDLDIGRSGQGGAEDAVVYTVRMRFPAVMPVSGLIGISQQVDLTARTVLRNQPFNEQGTDLPSIAGTCP